MTPPAAPYRAPRPLALPPRPPLAGLAATAVVCALLAAFTTSKLDTMARLRGDAPGIAPRAMVLVGLRRHAAHEAHHEGSAYGEDHAHREGEMRPVAAPHADDPHHQKHRDRCGNQREQHAHEHDARRARPARPRVAGDVALAAAAGRGRPHEVAAAVGAQARGRHGAAILHTERREETRAMLSARGGSCASRGAATW